MKCSMSEALNDPLQNLPGESGVYECVKAEYEITLSTDCSSRLHIHTPDGQLTVPVEELQLEELDRTVTVSHSDATMSQVIESDGRMFVQIHRNGDTGKSGGAEATLVSR